MAEFKDVSSATRMRDAITTIVRGILRVERPDNVYATVQSINRITRKAVVRFAGETVDIELPMSAIEPFAAGDIVRIVGSATDRYIEQPVGVDEPYLAFGVLAYADLSANSATFSPSPVVYPVTLSSIQPRAGRRVLIQVNANVQTVTAGTGFGIGIANNAGTIQMQNYTYLPTAGVGVAIQAQHTWITTGAAETWKMSAFTGSNTGFIVAANTARAWIQAIDMGPA